MKVSVSLPEEDLAFLDEYAARTGVTSRSAAVHEAIGLLRTSCMEDAYHAAWSEWDSGGDAELWEPTATDGVADAPR